MTTPRIVYDSWLEEALEFLGLTLTPAKLKKSLDVSKKHKFAIKRLNAILELAETSIPEDWGVIDALRVRRHLHKLAVPFDHALWQTSHNALERARRTAAAHPYNTSSKYATEACWCAAMSMHATHESMSSFVKFYLKIDPKATETGAKHLLNTLLTETIGVSK